MNRNMKDLIVNENISSYLYMFHMCFRQIISMFRQYKPMKKIQPLLPNHGQEVCDGHNFSPIMNKLNCWLDFSFLTKNKTPFILVALFLVQKPLVTLVTSSNLPITSCTYVFATNINFCAYLFWLPMGSYAPSLSSISCGSGFV